MVIFILFYVFLWFQLRIDEEEEDENGITIHTKEDEDGVTQVLGFEDDEDEEEEDEEGVPKREFDTVTLVPSDGDSGEVSYVLYVQEQEQKDVEKDDDLKVFDFDEAEDPNGEVN